MGRIRAHFWNLVHGQVPIWPAPIVGVTVAVTSVLIGSSQRNISVVSAMASSAAFLFGVLMAFTIGRTRERLAVVQNLLAKSDSALFSIYQLMDVFEEEDRRRIRELIDVHLTDQIDYRLVDRHLAGDSFLALTNAVLALNPTTKQQEVVYKELVSTCLSSSDSRSLIDAATGQAMSAMEWCGLFLLLVLILAILTVLPGGSLPGAVVVGVLAGTLVTLMILLRKIDLLRWHERVTIWEPAARLFRNMGLDPYVPRLVIQSGRYRPTGRARVVDYPDPYPKRSTKVITVEDFDAQGSPSQPVLAVDLADQEAMKPLPDQSVILTNPGAN